MPILIDTDAVVPVRRVAYWQQAFRRIFNARVHVDSAAEHDFHGRLVIHQIDRIAVGEFVSSPLSLSTHPPAGDASLVALVLETGSAVLEQEGQRRVLHERELILCSGSKPFRLKLSVSTRFTSIQLPKQEFLDLFPHGSRAKLVPVSTDNGVVALFADQLDSLLRRRASLGNVGSSGIADSILHLLGAVVCLVVTDDDDGGARHVSERRKRVRRFVRSQLRNPGLNVEMIAGAVHLSTRQIHRLFASEPMSIMQWVLMQRLEGCYRDLHLPDSARHPISEIAYRWGFSDQAYFSRVFRKQFNASPSEIRRQALSGIASDDPGGGVGANASLLSPTASICRVCRFRPNKASR